MSDGFSVPSWADQALGAAAALCLMVLGWLHLRLNSVERTAQAAVKDGTTKAETENLRLWTSFEAHKAEQMQFRERVLTEMARREDLAKMEDRLILAFKGKPHE